MKAIFSSRIFCAGLGIALAAAGLSSLAATLSAQQSAQAVSPQAVHQQRLQQLIQQVNEAYASGDANYRRGRLPEAKADFDHAVDLMLSSGFDIKNEPALQAVFDRIVDNINALEMDALKQGNGFAPANEETPADVASDVTFGAVDPSVLAKAKANLATTKSDLPIVVNEYVAAFINAFANTQKGHNTLLHSFQRGGRYRAMIQRVMAEEGVPQDLIYLAVAESGFNPRAIGPVTRSGGRAGGMWQFMPTGDYGLQRNSYVDERFDPEKSTRAYARYMKFIYNTLGDWYLSMAGYDWGAGNIQRAVQKTGYADFWELYKRNNLPVETKNYVPEILAAIIIANNPKQYGFDEITLDPPVLTDTVTVNYSLDLRLVSDVVNAPLDEIQALNPSLLRNVTPPDASFDLHLPAGAATLFQQRIAKVPESKRTAWRYHRIAPDDTLESVARTYRVNTDDLASVNQLQPGQSLAGVEAVVVPTEPVVVRTAHETLYTARRGDTLVSIADRFGISLAQLRSWNGIRSGVGVAAGRRLHVTEPVRATGGGKHHRGAAASASDEERPRKSSAQRGRSSAHATSHASSASNRSGKAPRKKRK
jgi:membrane-bound lytic murein transglycosylase D